MCEDLRCEPVPGNGSLLPVGAQYMIGAPTRVHVRSSAYCGAVPTTRYYSVLLRSTEPYTSIGPVVRSPILVGRTGTYYAYPYHPSRTPSLTPSRTPTRTLFRILHLYTATLPYIPVRKPYPASLYGNPTLHPCTDFVPNISIWHPCTLSVPAIPMRHPCTLSVPAIPVWHPGTLSLLAIPVWHPGYRFPAIDPYQASRQHP